MTVTTDGGAIALCEPAPSEPVAEFTAPLSRTRRPRARAARHARVLPHRALLPLRRRPSLIGPTASRFIIRRGRSNPPKREITQQHDGRRRRHPAAVDGAAAPFREAPGHGLLGAEGIYAVRFSGSRQVRGSRVRGSGESCDLRDAGSQSGVIRSVHLRWPCSQNAARAAAAGARPGLPGRVARGRDRSRRGGRHRPEGRHGVRASSPGVSDRATKRAVTADDLFMAGSTGKTFFAARRRAADRSQARSISTRRFRSTSGTRPWFARLPNAKDITVRHLMTHTSGLVRYEMNPKFTADLRAAAGQGLDAGRGDRVSARRDAAVRGRPGLGLLRHQLHRPRHDPRGRSPGTKLYDEVRTRFLEPLKLTRVVPSTSRRIPGLVHGLRGPARSARPARRGDRRTASSSINPQFEWTGGGFATSPLDLARWGHELYAGQGAQSDGATADDRRRRAGATRPRNQVRPRRHRPAVDAGRADVGTQRLLSRLSDGVARTCPIRA